MEQSMTVERLEQYRFLRRELDGLRARAMDAPGADCAGMVAYAEAEIARLQRVRELAAELADIEAFIGAIKDIQLRQIIRLRFVGGESWNIVARRVGGQNGQDGVRKRVKRFFASF